MRLSEGIQDIHPLPRDLQVALKSNENLPKLWNSLTTLARNEFICWVVNAKAIETRKKRVRRTTEELLEGKRRPCCWIGCVHRKDKELSKTQKWVLGR